MAYTMTRKPKSNYWEPSAQAKANEVIFGVLREFTVYATSKFNNTCSATGTKISRGDPIAMYVDDNGDKKYTVWPIPASVREPRTPFANFIPDKYKIELRDTLRNSTQHISVLARAGSGKTKGFCWAITEELKNLGKVAAIAFGVRDSIEMKRILPDAVYKSTSHSFCFTALKKKYPKLKFNGDKLDQLIEETVGEGNELYHVRNLVEEIVAKCKCDAVTDKNRKAILQTIESYAITVKEGLLEEVVDYVQIVLKKSLNVTKYGLDFDDQIWLAAVTDVTFDFYDVICVDEVQDFSYAQLLIIEKLIKQGSRILAVGDDNQAMYEFRGARHDAFERIRNLLENDKRGMKAISMPICYRCSIEVLKDAQTIVPDIEPRPDAPLGSVTYGHDVEEMMESVGAGDAIICRTNRPVIKIAHKLLEANREFALLGGEVEATLICKIIYYLTWNSGKGECPAAELALMIKDWIEVKTAMTTNANLLELYQGRADVIAMFAEHCKTADDVMRQVRRVFMANDFEDKIMLGTFHRVKGAEANTVWIIPTDLKRVPQPKTPSEVQQERNALYVSKTRAKLNTRYVAKPVE